MEDTNKIEGQHLNGTQGYGYKNNLWAPRDKATLLLNIL